MAQMVEQLIRNQQVAGSSPAISLRPQMMRPIFMKFIKFVRVVNQSIYQIALTYFCKRGDLIIYK